jgi:hypothetical protein
MHKEHHFTHRNTIADAAAAEKAKPRNLVTVHLAQQQNCLCKIRISLILFTWQPATFKDVRASVHGRRLACSCYKSVAIKSNHIL